VKGIPTNEGQKRGNPPKKTLFYCYIGSSDVTRNLS